MKDEIIIKIEIERLDSNTAKINDLIMELVLKLKEEGVDVLNYSRIETKFINLPKDG